MTRSRVNVYEAISQMHATRGLCIALAGALGSCALDFPQPTSWAANDVTSASPQEHSAERGTDASSTSAPAAWPTGTTPTTEQTPAAPDQDMQADAAQPDAPVFPAQADAAGTDSPDAPAAAAPPPNLQPESAPAEGSMGEPAAPSSEETEEPFVLTPVGFPTAAQGLRFPDTAVSPYERSPAFKWSGVPNGTKSLALVFRDRDLDLVRWLIWDIPPTVTELPEGITPLPNPTEVPGSSQSGSLGTGYSPPRIPNGQYEFTLWALDVRMLPNTLGLTADQILSRRLPMHAIATTDPVVVVNAR
jgi:Raf kinase inhibitor-like YbhB/YbcL family protein